MPSLSDPNPTTPRTAPESTERLQVLLDSAPVILFTADADGVITDIVGKGAEALAGPIGDYLNQQADDCPANEEFAKALAGRQTTCTLRMETGNVFEVTYSPHRDPTGHVCGVVGVATHITERVEAEQQRLVLENLCLQIAREPGIDAALGAILSSICRFKSWPYAEAWLPSHRDELYCRASHWETDDPTEEQEAFRHASTALALTVGRSLPGRVFQSGSVELVREIGAVDPSDFLRGPQAAAAGLTSAFAVPVVAEDEVLSVLVFFLAEPSAIDDSLVHWIRGAGAQLGLLVKLKQAEAEARQRGRRLQELAAKLAKAESEERRRIAKGLHDGVGQTLSLALIKLNEMAKNGPATLRPRLDGLGGLLRRADEETRSLTFQLSPPVLYELGFEPALEWLAERMREEYGVSCSVEREANPPPIEEALRSTVFQMVRELLHNVAKHAAATQVWVRVHRANNLLRVDVEDNGIGFDPDDARRGTETSGFGLFNIRERAAYIGGHLEILSEKDRGTRVTIVAPLVSGETSAET